jgi:O-antigen/teichoic acid export membrane protein
VSTAPGLGRAALYATAATALERTVALGIALYLPRHLPLDDFGRYAFVLAFFSLFQVLPDLGLEAVLVTRLAGASEDHAELAGRGAVVRLVVSLVGASLGLLVLALTADDPILLRAGAIWSSGLIVNVGSPYRVLLRAEQRLGRYLVLVAGQAAVALGGLALVLRANGGILPVMLAVAAAAPVGVLLGRVLCGAGARMRLDRTLLRELTTEAWPLAGSTLLFFGAQQLVLLLLVRMHSAAAMGLFAGAQKLTEAANLLPQALMLSVLPALAAEPERATRTARDVARLLAVLLVPVALVFALFPELVLVTILGNRLAEAAPVLRTYSGVVVLAASGAVMTNLLVVRGQQRLLLVMTATSALFVVGLGALAVPSEGAIGAAAAIVVGTATGQLGLLVASATRRQAAAVLLAVLRPLLLGVAAAALARFAAEGIAELAILLVAYVAGLVVSRTVTSADVSRWAGAQEPVNSRR